jgi:hypothetical protein
LLKPELPTPGINSQNKILKARPITRLYVRRCVAQVIRQPPTAAGNPGVAIRHQNLLAFSSLMLEKASFHLESALFRPGGVNLRVFLCGVPQYASA